LTEEVVSLHRPRITHAHIDLRWQIPPESLTISADPEQFSHIIVNLLTNALDAAGPGGWVEIKVGWSPQKRVFLEIIDSGPGPNPEIADRLFEPFVSGKSEGMGLGLALAKQIIETHGGTLSWFRDRECTCFRLEMACIAAEGPLANRQS
jgi:signal transduction histidine kinase